MSEFFGIGKNENRDVLLNGIVGDLARVILKLKANRGIAFLTSALDRNTYISPDNSHNKAAEMAGLRSNNSDSILVKGRIMPATRSIQFLNYNQIQQEYPNINLFLMTSDVALAIKIWLGADFDDYKIVVERGRSGSPGVTRPYEGD